MRKKAGRARPHPRRRGASPDGHFPSRGHAAARPLWNPPMRNLAWLAFVGTISGCGSPNPSSPTPAGLPSETVSAIPGERLENPLYVAWAKFPVGARVVQRSVTETKGIEEKTVSTISYKLVE